MLTDILKTSIHLLAYVTGLIQSVDIIGKNLREANKELSQMLGNLLNILEEINPQKRNRSSEMYV